jgi:NitT/TauT family transport system substrate-binding protein
MKRPVVAAALAAIALAGCSSAARSADPAAAKARAGGAVGAVVFSAAPGTSGAHQQVLTLGYVADVPDAVALVGLQEGYLRGDLSPAAELDAVPFTDGAAEAAALAAGRIDAAYIDPVAAVSAWQASRGGIRILAGAASGGSKLVVSSRITKPGQLAEQRVAALAGTTQQAALDDWLAQHGQLTTAHQDASMPGPAAVAAFRAGTIAGAWEPAPFDTEMAADGGHVVATESSLWPGRQEAAVLAVTSRLLTAHPAWVNSLLRAHIQAQSLLATNIRSAQAAVEAQLSDGTRLSLGQVTAAMTGMQFTDDPDVQAIIATTRRAKASGILGATVPTSSMFDLRPLNAILRSVGQLPVAG